MKASLNYKAPKVLLKSYKEFKGSLMHLIIKTRFDIYYAVLQFSQFSNNPTDEYYTQLKQILRYIRDTTNMGIAYKRNKNITINIQTDTT